MKLDEDALWEQDWPLHALCRRYARGNCPDDTLWLAQIQDLLFSGISPAEADEDGRTPFEFLNDTRANAEWEYAPEAAKLLVLHGFNPLLKNRHAAIPLLDIFLGVETGSAHAQIGLGALQGLIERETTSPLRDEEGGNPLHALCKTEPGVLPSVLEDMGEGLSGKPALPEHWFNAPNNDGRRPLDMIWDERGEWGKLLTEHDLWSREISAELYLEATENMVARGADITSPNANGNLIARTIWMALSQDTELADLAGPTLTSHLQQWKIDEGTPAATRRIAPGARL